MTSRFSLSLIQTLRSMAVVLLTLLPCLAFAQWRVVAVNTAIDAMRFNTITDAHAFMKTFRSGEIGARSISRIPGNTIGAIAEGVSVGSAEMMGMKLKYSEGEDK